MRKQPAARVVPNSIEPVPLSSPELEVARGERLAAIGPNGSGKTTLLRVAADKSRNLVVRANCN